MTFCRTCPRRCLGGHDRCYHCRVEGVQQQGPRQIARGKAEPGTKDLPAHVIEQVFQMAKRRVDYERRMVTGAR